MSRHWDRYWGPVQIVSVVSAFIAFFVGEWGLPRTIDILDEYLAPDHTPGGVATGVGEGPNQIWMAGTGPKNRR